MTVRDEEKEEEDAHDVSGDESGEREFPDAFYDPVTQKVMMDPVVNPDGDSFDRSTIDGKEDQSVSYYPNRTLKDIIEFETEVASNSIGGSVRRLNEKMREGWGRLVEKSAFAIERRPLPEAYYCPITCELMVDPVITPEGYSYEYDAISNWIAANGVSPMTRKGLSVSDLRDNNALYQLIQEERNRTDESLHPSIRRWKESGAAQSRRPRPPPTAPDEEQDSAADDNDTTPTNQNYPTTHAQIRARRMRRRSASITICAIVLAVCVVVGVIPYGFVGLILGVLILMSCACRQHAESNN